MKIIKTIQCRSNGGIVEPAYIRPADLRGTGATDRQRASDHGHYRFEPIRFVDISTDKVVGDQPINNTIRLKPKETGYEDGEILAIVTIVTERYRTQYALLYTTRMQEAVTDKEIEFRERNAYNNPAVSMSQADMTQFARRIWNSPCQIPQREKPGTPHDDEIEQHLRGR